MNIGLLPGELVITRLDPLPDTPDWCNHLTNPTVNRLKLVWKSLAMKAVEDTCVTITSSTDFPLGEPWLMAYIQYQIIGEDGCLYLTLTSKKVLSRVIARVISSVNKKDPVSDFVISKVNAESGKDSEDYWTLSTDCHSLVFDKKNYASLDIEIIIEVVIMDVITTPGSVRSDLKIDRDLGLQLLDKDDTDVILKVDDKELRAHKCILRARSPVLKAMLDSDMSEGRTGVIKLRNMSAAAAECFRNFIYMAGIEQEKLMETAMELLPASTMYDMPDLQAVSENALLQTITAENVGGLLMLACLHNAPQLKTNALDFIKRNKNVVFSSNGWKEAVAENPGLILESLTSIV